MPGTPSDTSCASVWTADNASAEPSNRTACMARSMVMGMGPKGKRPIYLSTRCNGTRRVFTFVREPLGHFVAGWAEYTARSAKYQGADGKPRNVTEVDAELFLQSLIFDGSISAVWSSHHSLLHMAPMAGVGRQRFGWPEFVGRLEHADDDWAAIFGGTQLAQTKLDSSLRVHQMSSSDGAGARQSMRNLLQRRADLRRGVCTLIGADYDWLECLGYKRSRCWSGEALGEAAQSMCKRNPSCAGKI